jgi:hypothetical protein
VYEPSDLTPEPRRCSPPPVEVEAASFVAGRTHFPPLATAEAWDAPTAKTNATAHMLTNERRFTCCPQLRLRRDVGLRRRASRTPASLWNRPSHSNPTGVWNILLHRFESCLLMCGVLNHRAQEPTSLKCSRSSHTESPRAMHDRFTTAEHHEVTRKADPGTQDEPPSQPPSSITTSSESPRSPLGRSGLLGVWGEFATRIQRNPRTPMTAQPPRRKMRVISSLWRFDVHGRFSIVAASARHYCCAAQTAECITVGRE